MVHLGAKDTAGSISILKSLVSTSVACDLTPRLSNANGIIFNFNNNYLSLGYLNLKPLMRVNLPPLD
jgi:hypothetical protein